MTLNKKFAATIVAVAVVALYGCGKEEPKKAEAPKAPAAPPVEQPTVVKIGHAGPLTGGIAHLGKDNENGARLAVEQANAKGISIGGKKIRFELQGEDDQADPKLGPTIAQKFADAKVAGVVGHLNSGVTIPASAVYNQAGIPMISGSATNPKLTEQGFKNIFRLVARDDQQGPAVAQFLNSMKVKKVAVVDDATAYGEGLANEVEKTLKAAGVQVVAREKTNDKATDFKAILTKMKGRAPDAIFYGGMDATGGPMLKQARELGIKAVFSFGDGACTDTMKQLAGDAVAEGLVCSQAGLPVAAASKAFLDAHKAKFNTDPIIYAPFTYDAANVLIAAMQKADSADPAKYLPELQKISYTGATGPIAFDEKGDRKNAEVTIFTMKGGKLEPVAIVQGGKSISFADFMKAAAPAPAAAPAAAAPAAPAAAPAPAAPAPKK
ncbi:MAG: branched-chain amino acid ABC transporter substrate-binding protein [Betaproteobacteria bacterium]|nr:branched-chain amino acid ABC transporter substrate-binding protein [Betaproteobacteria bacterium]MDH5285820.1 branched-chain amino acid ABC transporter substrate-binding protein [Betaproteobacteria bacterium]